MVTESPDPEEIHRRTAAHWHLDDLPLPKGGWLACPVCRDPDALVRWWMLHQKHDATISYRCDVSFKCCQCGAVWQHGLVLDESAFQSLTDRWPEGKRITRGEK